MAAAGEEDRLEGGAGRLFRVVLAQQGEKNVVEIAGGLRSVAAAEDGTGFQGGLECALL